MLVRPVDPVDTELTSTDGSREPADDGDARPDAPVPLPPSWRITWKQP